jgi:hypothetical protein
LFLDPKLLNKMPSDLFYDEIRLINFSFSLSESEFIWEVPLGLKVLGSTYLSLKCKTAEQKCHQFCSMMKFVEQN